MKRRILVTTLFDWSKSFVDRDGSFYCGSTTAQKRNASSLAEIADVVICGMDLHPIFSEENSINGGIYPAHNVGAHWKYGPDFVYAVSPGGRKLRLGKKTMSPELTLDIARRLRGRKAGIIVPRGVYFQGGVKKPWIAPKEVERTFHSKIISADQFLEGDCDYVIAPKQYFDATRLDSDLASPPGMFRGVPGTNYNVYSLLEKKYPPEGYDLVFLNTGVVEGICRLHSGAGLRQVFKSSRIVNPADATTPLFGVGLGYETARQSREACVRVCKDVGIEYTYTAKLLREFGQR